MDSLPRFVRSWDVSRLAGWLGMLVLSLMAQSCATLPGASKAMVKTVSPGPRESEIRSALGYTEKQTAESIMVDSHKPSPLLHIKAYKREASPLTHISMHKGEASWYGPRFHGKKTASGEIFDQTKFTAAHRTFPLGSRAKVTHLDTGKSIEVEINDRGPYVKGRIIDLSRAAARALGIIEEGTANVQVELIALPPG